LDMSKPSYVGTDIGSVQIWLLPLYQADWGCNWGRIFLTVIRMLTSSQMG
jgi:hypothetical protein